MAVSCGITIFLKNLFREKEECNIWKEFLLVPSVHTKRPLLTIAIIIVKCGCSKDQERNECKWSTINNFGNWEHCTAFGSDNQKKCRENQLSGKKRIFFSTKPRVKSNQTGLDFAGETERKCSAVWRTRGFQIPARLKKCWLRFNSKRRLDFPLDFLWGRWGENKYIIFKDCLLFLVLK